MGRREIYKKQNTVLIDITSVFSSSKMLKVRVLYIFASFSFNLLCCKVKVLIEFEAKALLYVERIF